MAQNQNLCVMYSFMPILHSLATFKAENFRGNNWRPMLRNWTLSIIFALVLVAAVLGILSNAWMCYSLKFNLSEILVPLPVLLSDIQMLIILVSIIMVNRVIESTIDRLQEICETRKCRRLIFQAQRVKMTTFIIAPALFWRFLLAKAESYDETRNFFLSTPTI